MLLLLAACAARRDAAFTDPSGVTGRYALRAPEGAATEPPDGALLFFHWDGGDDAYGRRAAARAAIAAEHGLLYVAMRVPEPGGCWWSPNVQAYARYVDAFVRVLIAERGLDPGRIFLTGLSGGADFAAELPYHAGFAWGGGVVALCGGDVPRLDGGECATEQDPPAAPMRAAPDGADLRYDFAIDATDPLLAASKASAAFYTAAGFPHVRHRVVPGNGHCGFADGFAGLRELREGLDYVDPRTNP